MSLFSILLLLVIAGICGAIGRSIAGAPRGGWLAAIVVGFIGAFVGLWVAQEFRLPEPLTIRFEGRSFPILWSIIGSALSMVVLSLLSRNWGGRGTWFRGLRTHR